MAITRFRDGRGWSPSTGFVTKAGADHIDQQDFTQRSKDYFSNNPGGVGSSSSSGSSRGGSSGGGGSSAPTRYSTTPLQAVKQSAISGEAIKIPNFPNTPQGVIQRGNFMQGVAQLKLDLNKNKSSASNVLARKANNEIANAQNVATQTQSVVSAYQAEGTALQTEAQALQDASGKVNNYDQGSVNAFNAQVNAFNVKVKAYQDRGTIVQNQVNQTQTVIARANEVFSNAEKAYRLQPGRNAPLVNLFPEFKPLDVGVKPVSDTKTSYVPVQQVRKQEVKADDKTYLSVASPETITYGKRIVKAEDDLLAGYVRRNKYAIEKGMLVGESIPNPIEAEAKAKGVFSGIYDLQKRFEVSAEEAKLNESNDLAGGLKSFAVGGFAGSFGTGITLAEDLLPITQGVEGIELKVPGAKLAGGIAYAVSNPVKTGVGLVTEATTNPIFFVGDLIGSTILFTGATSGLKFVGSKASSLLGRTPYVLKGVAKGEKFSIALKKAQGATLGTVRTDIVTKLTGRKTFNISSITSKDVASALTNKGKSQYLQFGGSERKLFERAVKGREASFIKKNLKELGINEKDIVGFTAESGKATGLIEKFSTKGKVNFNKLQAEPYGKFAASRTATAPLISQGESSGFKLGLFSKRAVSPSVTVTVGKKGVLSTQGGISKTISRLGFDITKTNAKIQKYFKGALDAGARPSKLKELRSKFGVKEVKLGKVESTVSGKAVSSPSRLFGLSGEEEFIYSFGTKTKVLGGLKERVFSPAVVNVNGKRFLLNVKRTIGEGSGLIDDFSNVAKKGISGSRKVSSVRTVGVLDKVVGSLALSSVSKGFSSSVYSGSSISRVGYVPSITSLSSSVPQISSLSSVSVPSVSSVSPKISASMSSPVKSISGVSVPVSSVSISGSISSPSVSKMSLSASTPSISSASSGVSTPRISQSISSSIPQSISRGFSSSISSPSVGFSKGYPSIPSLSSGTPSLKQSVSYPKTPSLSSGVSSVPKISSLSKSIPSINKSSKLSSGKKYPSFKSKGLSYSSPSLKKQNFSLSYKTPSMRSSFTTPKYKEQKLVGSKSYFYKDKYLERNAFRDIKSLKNRTDMFGFKTRNDFNIKNIFKSSNKFSKGGNLKKDYYKNMHRSKNNYNYKNEYDVSIKYKGYPAYKYSSKLVDKEMFDLKASVGTTRKKKSKRTKKK